MHRYRSLLVVLQAIALGCGTDPESPGSEANNEPGTGGSAASASASGPASGSGARGGETSASSSSSGTGAGAGSAEMPDWAAAITPGTWVEIGDNTLADVDPEDDPAANPDYPDGAPWHANSGQKCMINCWNGGAFASGYGTHGSLLVFGGGHAGYYGSEVYAFDMATRRWARVTDPYPGPIDFPYADGLYPDGSAIPMHTYDQVDYHPESNAFVVMKGSTDGYPGTTSVAIPVVHMLDLATKVWKSSPWNDGGSFTGGGNSCFDRKRNVFWISSLYEPKGFTKFDPQGVNADGTIGSFTNYAPAKIALDGGAACDPDKDIYVYTEFRYDDVIFARDLANPDAPRVQLTEAGDAPEREAAGGFEWSPRRHAFLFWRRGGGVYELALTSGDWATGTWTWKNLTSADNTVVPEDMQTDNGVYSRFRIAEYGDDEIAVVVNNVDGAVYAFRVP